MTDYTIASKIVPPNIDPLAITAKAQALGTGILQNRLLGMNIGQTQAQRAAAQGSVNPETGQFDVDSYAAKLATGGASPEAMQGAQAMRIQQLQAKIQGLNLTKEQLAVSAQELAGGAQVGQAILANATKDPAQLTKDAIAATIDNGLIKSGLVRTPEGIQHARDFIATLGNDPAQNAARVQEFVNQSTDITRAMGGITDLNTGGNVVQRRINPATGQQDITSQVALGRSPEAKANLIPTYDPETKTTKLVPSGEIIGDSGKAAMHPQTGPAVGETEAASGNVQQALALQNRASIVPQRKAALANIVGTLDKFTTGPKAASIGTLKGLATQFGISTKSIDESKAAQDEFNKLASQIALDQWGALGGTGSNHQLETTMHANPNEAMSKMGIKNVAALLQGNEDAIGAQYSAWQKFKAVHGAASYDKFQEGWNRYYDPRVFQAQHMEPAAVKTMLAGMTAEERKTFARDQAIAQQAGWLSK